MKAQNKVARKLFVLVSIFAVIFLAAKVARPVSAMADGDHLGASSRSSGLDDSSSSSQDDSSGEDKQAGELEFKGNLTAISGSVYTVGGKQFTTDSATEIKLVAVGDFVEVHYSVAADGSVTVREIEQASENETEDSHDDVNDDSSHDVNDDHGQDGSSGSSHDSQDDSPDSPEVEHEGESGS
jgi:hypothetical protein